MKALIDKYIASWKRKGYPQGLPDEAPARLEDLGKVPSYRAICTAVMKNDKALTSLGFTRRPCDLYMELKREEIAARGDTVLPWQPKLF